ncbi:FecR family protein [Hugenholtzia roseola]|uniref:FecR family protein n=1 Tax=Hugenholtzia roseola TaxID=1002 RepID=UPI0004225F8E|nr:FecR domain-containing protein [Hugenholtzia roseola]
MQEELLLALLVRYFKNETTEAETAQLLAWLAESPDNERLFKAYQEVWGQTGKLYNSYTPDVVRAWRRFENRIAQQEAEAQVARQKTVRLWKQIATWAAALFIGIALGHLSTRLSHSDTPLAQAEMQVVQSADKALILLADGTKVWLNKNSKLTYLSDFQHDRKVTLEGEAFFEVQRDENSPFRIQSGEALTTVLGTSFNIRAYPQEKEVRVTVAEGKVEVRKARGFDTQTKPQTLTANQVAIVSPSADAPVVQLENKNLNYLSWKHKKLVFENRPVGEIIDLLSEIYQIQVMVSNPEIRNCQFTGTFEESQPYEMLEVIAYSLNLDLKEKGKKYWITGSGCPAL